MNDEPSIGLVIQASKVGRFVNKGLNRFKKLFWFDAVKHFLSIFEKQSRKCGIKSNEKCRRLKIMTFRAKRP
jgi:hypothetical protein